MHVIWRHGSLATHGSLVTHGTPLNHGTPPDACDLEAWHPGNAWHGRCMADKHVQGQCAARMSAVIHMTFRQAASCCVRRCVLPVHLEVDRLEMQCRPVQQCDHSHRPLQRCDHSHRPLQMYDHSHRPSQRCDHSHSHRQVQQCDHSHRPSRSQRRSSETAEA